MSRRASAALAALLLSLLVLTPAHAAPGDLDPGYGVDGREYHGGYATVTAESLVTAEGTFVAGIEGTRMFVAKFTAAGQIDTDFGTGGVVRFGPGDLDTREIGTGASVGALAMTPQGLAVGGAAVAPGDAIRKMFVLWLNPATGAPGTQANIVRVQGATKSSRVNGMVQWGNRLLLVGEGTAEGPTADAGDDAWVAVSALVNADAAQVDAGGWGADGTDAFGDPAYPGGAGFDDVVIADGVPLVTGYMATNSATHLLLGRLAVNGNHAITGYEIGDDDSWGKALVADGASAYVALDLNAGGRDVHGVAKVGSGGALDTSFGSGGVAHAGLGDGGHLQTGGIALSGDRLYVVGGRNGAPTWTVARFTTSGAVDPGFGANGVASIAYGDASSSMAKAVRVADGKATLGGYAMFSASHRPATARVDASTAAAQTTGTPAQNANTGTTANPVSPVTPAGPETVAVRGLTFTVVASTEKRVNVLQLRGFHFTSATTILRAAVPYLDLSWSFSASACGTGMQDGTITEVSGDSGEMVIAPERPARVHWKVCLETQELARFCSAAKIGGVIKKGRQDFDVFDDILGEMRKCRIDYDVKLTKAVDTPDLSKLRNTAAPAGQKRKPIEAAIECSSNPESQLINAVWGEGVAVGASYGFHEPAPGVGYTIPAGYPSFVRLNATTKTSPMLPLEAKVFVDGDETGMAQMKPRSFKGETILQLVPQRPGTIRACVVYDAANGVATATVAIRVVPTPKAGTVWRTAAGRQIEMTKTGPKLLTSFGGAKARAAWNVTDLWNGLMALFRGTPQVTQIAATQQAPEKKAAAARGAGLSVGQLGTGGTLGTQPGLPVAAKGTLLSAQDGKFAATTGTILKQNPGGTLIGQAGGNVVSAGSANGQGGNPSTKGAQVVPPNALSLISDNGLGLISDNGLGLIGTAAGNLIGTAAGNLIGTAAGNLIGAAGGNVVSAGSLN